ncbi:hypothetical protein KC660_01140 [Candidatus Dojkabacteria bacterium]|uniref:Sulfotransferase domain-containing protein n=1 Tax=Candidatus Dojkabacteria bacterium TaxID=2099670 RepID=A0A955L349_9BACT|nr:hypothetical protein [Candidatus Dojkabacteria bacterium]
MVTSTIYHFFGLSRSGNHPILNWIIQNSGQAFLFHNDVYAPNMSRILVPSELRHDDDQDISMILSYEDRPLDALHLLPTYAGRDEIVPNALHRTILLLRDPFNTFASRKKYLDQRGKLTFHGVSWNETKELWRVYAQEYMRETRYFDDNLILINYNQWFLDKRYRDNWLYAVFGQTQNHDIGIERVSLVGEGSSYDGTAFEGRANEMDTLGRWQSYIHDPDFLGLFDNDTLRLSLEVFGGVFDVEFVLKEIQSEKDRSGISPESKY